MTSVDDAAVLAGDFPPAANPNAARLDTPHGLAGRNRECPDEFVTEDVSDAGPGSERASDQPTGEQRKGGVNERSPSEPPNANDQRRAVL